MDTNFYIEDDQDQASDYSSSFIAQFFEDEDSEVDIFNVIMKDPVWTKRKTAEDQRIIRQRRKEARESGVYPKGFKKPKRPVYRRNEITAKDLQVLQFLTISRLASADHIAHLLGVKRSSAHHRLRALREWKMVRSLEVYPNSPLVWSITTKGITTAREHGVIRDNQGLQITNSSFDASGLSHHLAGAQALLHLKDHAKAWNWENVIDDLELKRLTSYLNNKPVSFRKSEASASMQRRDMDIMHGMNQKDASMKNALVYFTVHPFGKRGPHRPDFVIDNGSGAPYAIEVELSGKSKDALEEILLSYVASTTYKKVIYYYDGVTVMNRIKKALKEAGIDDVTVSKKFIFIPLPEQKGTAHLSQRLCVF